jgi:1,4-dihydroxy-2-naphthoate octaprenyltransferase
VLAAICTILFSLSFLFLVAVITGNIAGWFYSAPPLRLVYRDLGELVLMLSVGFFVPGLAYWINKGSFDGLYLLFILPLLLYGLGFILNVEMPDSEIDAQARKKTFIARKGRPLGFLVIGFVFFLNSLYFLLVYLFVRQVSDLDFRIIALFSFIPLSMGLLGIIKRKKERIAEQIALMNLISLLLLIIFCDVYFLRILLT